MFLYRVDTLHATEGNSVQWAGSKKEAMKLAAQWDTEYVHSQSVTKVSIPKDKSGLINWLNANLNTDNG